MKKNTKTARSPHWVVGVVALLLFSQTPGLLPLLFAGLAWVDGGHHVHLGAGTGGYQLVLQHDVHASPGSAYSCQHHHGLMDRILVAFANPDASREADHVFSFHNLDLTEYRKQLICPPSTELPLVPELPCAQLDPGQSPHLCPNCRPPPATATTAFIHQTVLLI